MTNYPFFYFYDLEFDADKILEFVNTIPQDQWIGPHIGNYDPDVEVEPHRADNKLWTANNRDTDFTACEEGFVESPLEAIDTKTGEHYSLVPKGLAFMVPNDPTWHYSWLETIYDFRYTLHLRGVMPQTYEKMKELYLKDG